MSARLFVVSGPSGAGKGTIVARVRAQRPDMGLTVSATTRAPRAGEVEGISYLFMNEEEFARRVAAGEFLEYASVHAHHYGTLESQVREIIDSGRSVILEIDYQGALAVKKRIPEAVLIFIEPPSMAVLEQRLRDRGTESSDDIDLRMANAAKEMQAADAYDVRIVNDDLDTAVAEVLATLETYERDGGNEDVRD